MAERKVLVREEKKKPAGPLAPDASTAWSWIGWFGLVLAAAGIFDFLLAWYPLGLGSAEWEFGTITASYAGLPLPTMGLAALLGSALARGVRWQILVLSIGALVVAGLLRPGHHDDLVRFPGLKRQGP